MLDKEKEDIVEISQGVAKVFALQGNSSVIENQNYDSLKEFKAYLTQKISHLIENNFDLLINILYRIDIGEEKLQKIFSAKNKNYIPEELSDLIIERQLQKIHFRRKYKQGEI